MKPLHERLGGYRPSDKPRPAQKPRLGRLSKKELPPKVDLRPFLSPVEEQVGNSCVANAFAGAYEYLATRELGQSGDVSRLFIYYNARAAQGEEGEDCGSQMDNAIEGLKQYGACLEDMWPNDEGAIIECPSDDAYTHGANFTITKAEFIETTLDAWRGALAEGHPIAFALNTFDSFDEATENKGRVPMPKKSDNVRETHGWHAMLCVGYLDKDEMFVVRNSWSPKWGDKGYCYIPYKYVMDKELNGNDSWIIKGVSDLDFNRDAWSQDDDSYFAEEGSIQLFDFYVATKDWEGFADALGELCGEWTESEEDFYFDYEEQTEKRKRYAVISNFDIAVEDADAFLEALDGLCQEWADNEDYSFQVEGNDEEGEEEGSEEEETGEEETNEYEEEEEEEPEEEESEGGEVVLTGFYVYTEKVESVAKRIDKLCAKYASDDYTFDYEEDEDKSGVYLSVTEFTVPTDDPEGLLGELEALCEKVADEGGYNWEQE